MKIKIVTGQRNGNIMAVTEKANNVKYFPESREIHPYNLVNNILNMCERYYNANYDLTIVTYSEVVLDAIRLWGARTQHCDIIECVNALDNGEIHVAKFNKIGEMDFYENGVFDIKKIILKELIEIKSNKN